MNKPIDWIKENARSNKILQEVGPYLNLGWQLAITVVLCFALGHWLDDEFSIFPVLTIILSLFGVTAGLVNFIRTVLKESKRQEQK